MDSATDNLDKTLKLARSRYERARAGQAVLGFLPVFLLVGAVCAVGGRPWWALGFGTVLF
jgi:hypothetical protein